MAYESVSLKVGIHKGTMIRIHPSQSYQGIDEGLVKIVDIVDSQENP